MAKIHNTDTIKRILDDAGIQISIDDVPQELARKIVPVLISNPLRIANVIKSSNRSVTGLGTVFITPTDKDFYLTNAWVSFDCNATADSTSYFITATNSEGLLINLGILNKQTLTARNGELVLSYPTPLLLSRGTAINISQTFSVGASSIAGGISGYTVETLKR